MSGCGCSEWVGVAAVSGWGCSECVCGCSEWVCVAAVSEWVGVAAVSGWVWLQ